MNKLMSQGSNELKLLSAPLMAFRVLFHISDETFHHSIIDFEPANFPAAREAPLSAPNLREAFHRGAGKSKFNGKVPVLFVFSHFSSLSN